MNKKSLAIPYLIWSALFIIVPLLLIVYFSFFQEGQFSFQSYQKFLEPYYIKALWRSVQLAFFSTVICLIVAYPLAMLLSGKEMSNKQVVLLLVILPMWMNSLLRTYAWASLLENTGVINSLLQGIGLPTIKFLYGDKAVIFGMVYNFFPFMVLPIYNALCKIDPHLVEASYDLGANKVTTFRKVILPLSMPGVVTGIVMVFMPALTTFLITRLLGGGKVMLIGNIIEEQFTRTRDLSFGSAISMILMVLVLLALTFLGKKDSLDGKGGGLF
ncbi:ABC transporter permease [Sporanaerobium hydrogeniformans]|uniref:ABC transporter permease n=1 Tax=Sporanaerobium hydrogeniformans TaxID=3072179 RepID=A0AC61DET1_9FIRM|nr:ABC transporter permease [Sporanaerobium hydrogeniformans]PHV71553.1 ABC transporter permease [Sporanaerobium hydrogeniformans]